MNIVQAIKAQQRAETSARARNQRATGASSLAANRAFVPVLTIWGAATGGLSVMVMAPAVVEAAARAAMLPADAPMARLVLAGLAAALGAAICFGAGLGVKYGRLRIFGGSQNSRRSKASLVQMAVRRLQPLNPAHDLGSESFDAPFEPADAGDAPSADGQEDTCASDAYDRDAADRTDAAPSDSTAGVPQELDLVSFGQLPGRNAVWVETDAGTQAEANPAAEHRDGETGPEPSRPIVLEKAPNGEGSAAIAKLRAVPPGELSLVQMVERFAIALHDYQTTHEGDATHGDADRQETSRERDAVLSEALKALAKVTHAGMDKPARSSRDNHDQRGAA
ncbi:MAG: hypothetical protein ACXIT4_03935 [Erythrobacter sp.]